MKYLRIILILIITLPTNAEVITDGTLGQQHGNNLFHNFQDFNLNSSESTTFSEPNNIQNILS